jgi:hypothetical protein
MKMKGVQSGHAQDSLVAGVNYTEKHFNQGLAERNLYKRFRALGYRKHYISKYTKADV